MPFPGYGQGTITPEFAQQIEQLRMQYAMMGQEPPYPEAQVGGDAVEYLTNIALGVDQRQARDWAESLGINPEAFNQHVEQVELSTRSTPNAVFGAIDQVGQFAADNPALLLAAPFLAAAATGAFGAAGAGAAGGASGSGGIAGSGVLAGGQNAALGLTGLEGAGAIGAGLAPGAGVLLPGAAGAAAGGGIAGAGVLAGGQNAALGLTGLESGGAASALAPGAGVLLPGAGTAANALGSGAQNVLNNVPGGASGEAGNFSNWLSDPENWLPYLGSGINTLLGANAMDDAADAEAAALEAAIAEQRRQYDTTRADMMPWLDAGKDALGQLADPNTHFFASPDYQIVRSEGMRDIGNQFSAKGGAQSGNALRRLGEYTTGLASSEFGNWYNRQSTRAGLGQATASNLGSLGANTSANVGNFLAGQGAARGSGVLGRNAVYAGGVNDVIGNYLYKRRRP